ncbi:hypothetical protein H7X68_02130 [Candidatus Saccharibacteria bacterium]|nr:hypothetical protein [Candidatus Saccharibacteria bacterium]
MTQPYPQKERVLENTYQSIPSSWVDAHNIVQKFTTESAFIDKLSNDDSQPPDITSVEYANALSVHAQEYCDARKISQSQSDQIKLLANVPYYLHNQKESSYYENERDVRHLTDEEWQYYQGFKPYMIWYNQLLSDYVYTNPQATLSDMDTALIEQALPSFPGELESVERNIKAAVRGARTEAVSRELLDLTQIDYSPGTIDDDLRGGDLIVIYKGNRVKVDIKSAISDIAAVRGGYSEIDKHHLTFAIFKARRDGHDKTKHVVVIFPGFTDSDLGDSLSLQLPEKDIQKHADSLAKQLQLAFDELHL